MNTDELLGQLRSEKNKIDEAMHADLAEVQSPLLAEVLAHGIFNGGKRVRPLLTLLGAGICAADHPGAAELDDQLYRLAMLFEYLHAASLLHDDVIDHAAQRRGKKSANAIWGNTPVILAGDFLHTRAMLLAGTLGGKETLEIIARATSSMVEAEFLQMHNAENIDPSEQNYFTVLHGKTAALIAAACETGGLFGGGDMKQRRALDAYGKNLGLAFQIVDDLLDYLGDPSQTGKIVGNDLIEGKMTLPLIYALSAADGTDRQKALAILESDNETRAQSLDKIKALIAKNRGFDYAHQKAEALIQSAKGSLLVFSSCREKAVLEGLADYVLTRKK